MLKRSFSRRSILFGVQIITGIVAVTLSLSHALAQFSSPAVFGVYNRASSMGSGGFGGAGSTGQGALPYNSPTPMTSGPGVMNQQTSNLADVDIEPVVVDVPEFTYKGHDPKEPVLSIDSTMDQNGAYWILTGSGDKTAKLWTLEGVYDQETTEWSATSARVRKTFKDEHKQGITKAIFSPDYTHVLTSSYDQIGRLWNINAQENIRAYLGAKDRLWSIAQSPSGAYVAAACNDGRVYFWEASTAKKLEILPNYDDSQTVAGGTSDAGHKGPVFDVAFDPTSSFVATAGADGTTRIWNLGLLRQVTVLKGHADKVYSVRFSDDGSYVLTASRDKTARLWNPSTGEEVCRFIGHEGAVREAIFVAGTYVCTASDDGSIRLWSLSSANASSNQQKGMMDSYGMGTLSMETPAPATSSPYPTSGYSDANKQQNAGKPVRKEGFPKGTELVRFETGSPVFAVNVSEDMVYIFSGSKDGVAHVWRVPGQARYYGDASAGNQGNQQYGQYGNSQQGYGLGADPMANPSSLK